MSTTSNFQAFERTLLTLTELTEAMLALDTNSEEFLDLLNGLLTQREQLLDEMDQWSREQLLPEEKQQIKMLSDQLGQLNEQVESGLYQLKQGQIQEVKSLNLAKNALQAYYQFK